MFRRPFPVANNACFARYRWVRPGFACLPALFAALAAVTVSAQTLPAVLPGHAATTPADRAALPNSPDTSGELRGMWVICYSLTSPASVHQVVVTAVKYHLNAIFVQVRSRADAWYDSRYEPRAEALAHQPRSFDPLAQIVEEGHAAGLQVHAWLNTYLTWSQQRRPYSSDHLWNAHHDWFAHDRYGRLSTANTTDCEGVFLQASNPAVQDHLFDVFTDVASRYDLDGIHFDYVRYPNSTYDFSPETVARFNTFMRTQLTEEQIAPVDAHLRSDSRAYLHTFGSEWERWRRAQVSDLVARISAAVKADKPWMQVSAAVFADANDAKWDRGQDWMEWLKAGTVDAVALMAYSTDTQRVLTLTRRAVAAAGERKVYTGIGAWRLSAHDVAHKIAAVRKAGASGVNLFSYDGVHDRSHYLDTLARGVFASRSAPPRMRWLPSRSGAFKRGSPSTSPASPAGTEASQASSMPPQAIDSKH